MNLKSVLVRGCPALIVIAVIFYASPSPAAEKTEPFYKTAEETRAFYETAADPFEDWRAVISKLKTSDCIFYQEALELVDDSKQRLLANDADGFSTKLSKVMSLSLQPEVSLSPDERKAVYKSSVTMLLAADRMRVALNRKPVDPKPLADTICKKQSNCKDCQCVAQKGSTCTPGKGSGVPICTCFGCSDLDPSGPRPFEPVAVEPIHPRACP